MSLRLGSGPVLQPPETLLQSDQNNVTCNPGTHVTQPSYFPFSSAPAQQLNYQCCTADQLPNSNAHVQESCLLSPQGSRDLELFGVTLPKSGYGITMPTGCGYLVRGSDVERVQVLWPDPDKQS